MISSLDQGLVMQIILNDSVDLLQDSTIGKPSSLRLSNIHSGTLLLLA